MTVYSAASVNDLYADLKLAQSGDTIQLAAGTYSGVYIANYTNSNVTITSADPNNQAVITDMTLNTDAGLNFTNLTMTVAKDAPFYIYDSSNILFNNIDMHGSLDGNPNDDYRGLLIRGSNNVTISNSHFHELTGGITNDHDTNLTITGNLFDTIANDGTITDASQNVTFSNNVFTNFQNLDWTVHPDAIQFYTSGTTTASSNITIEGNVINRGTGTPIQGIFLNDEVGTLPYQNVVIDNNVIVGENYQGINVTHATNATITSNMVLAETDQNSWIDTINDASVYMADNLSTDFETSNSTVNMAGGDVLANALSTDNAASFSTWLSSTMTAGHITNAASQAEQQLLPLLSLAGYVDGPSPTGKSYAFQVTTLTGTANADSLRAVATGASHLYGMAGDDNLYGGTNGIASTLEGGAGNDYYRIYQSQDVVIEQPNSGNDVVFTWVNYTQPANVEQMTAEVAGLTLTGNSDNNIMTAYSGGGTLYGMAGDDTLNGGSGNDVLYGGDGNDRLIGNDGNDTIYGGDGTNYLYGQAGNDLLVGGSGTDTIVPGAGQDTMTGGGGLNYYNFYTADFATGASANYKVITDFNAANHDIINLANVDAISSTTALDVFKFIGTAAFDGKAGELRYQADGDGITLYGDTNGDGVADLAIHLSGVTTIASSSIWL